MKLNCRLARRHERQSRAFEKAAKIHFRELQKQPILFTCGLNKAKRVSDRLYAKAQRTFEQVWEEYRASLATSKESD